MLQLCVKHESSSFSVILPLLVRMKGLEPSRPKALAPKANVSTNSTTSAYDLYVLDGGKMTLLIIAKC